MQGPLRWVGALVAAGILVLVVTPMALDALRTSVTFGGAAAPTPPPDGTQAPTRAPTEAATDQDRDGQDDSDNDGQADDTGDQDAEEEPGDDGPETYTIEAGDTLAEIAEEFYGDASLWPRIAEANDIDDRTALRVGQELTIPPPDD